MHEQTQAVINDFRVYMDERVAELQPEIVKATTERRLLGSIVEKAGNGRDGDDV